VLRRILDERVERGQPGPSLICTSPLARARETAALIMPDLAVEEVPMLAEVDYGDYEGLTVAEIREEHPDWDLFTSGCPGGESPAAVAARCDSFIAKAERMAPGGLVVAFTHGHLSRLLTARLLGLPLEAAGAFYNDTASIAVIEDRRGDLVLTGWNITAD
jgi:probable phosphoglycerate mutase